MKTLRKYWLMIFLAAVLIACIVSLLEPSWKSTIADGVGAGFAIVLIFGIYDHLERIEGKLDATLKILNERTLANTPYILVAEIEKPTRDHIVSILTSAGYSCLEANNGKSAMDLLRSDARIRLVLSNMLLSEDVDGLTLLRHVKQHYPLVSFVAVTYLSDDEVRQEAIRSGADGYLLKPFESYRLLETVYDALAPSSTLRVG
jgi:CheY-like chemotaxis protein